MSRRALRTVIWMLCLTACCLVGEAAVQVANAQEPIVSRVAIVPPPPRQEAITAAPAAMAVWIAGSWNRTSEGWEWISGGWVQPPTANAVWMPGMWQQQRGGFVWVAGYWSTAQHGLIVPLPPAIPLSYPEKRVTVPKGKPVVWQSGSWEWRGSWVWQPGGYVESVLPNATWVTGQWEKMPAGSWRWTPSHWERGR
jgi:hypothetical protein